MISWLQQLCEKWSEILREKIALKECGCFIRCLRCNDIQNDRAECKTIDEHRYEYTCGKCGHVAVAVYGIAPVPLWEETMTFSPTKARIIFVNAGTYTNQPTER